MRVALVFLLCSAAAGAQLTNTAPQVQSACAAARLTKDRADALEQVYHIAGKELIQTEEQERQQRSEITASEQAQVTQEHARVSQYFDHQTPTQAAAWKRVEGRSLLIAPAQINLYCDGNKMTQIHGVAISRSLTVGSIAVLCTIFIHALAIGATVNFLRYKRKRGRTGKSLLVDLPILVLTIAFAFVAHLIEITLWAALFVICGEFTDFAGAYYLSAVNYSTLGYGDVIMSPSWKLLGPLEAADGTLMFGVSTAMIFAVIQRLVLTRFADLKDQ